MQAVPRRIRIVGGEHRLSPSVEDGHRIITDRAMDDRETVVQPIGVGTKCIGYVDAQARVKPNVFVIVTDNRLLPLLASSST